MKIYTCTKSLYISHAHNYNFDHDELLSIHFATVFLVMELRAILGYFDIVGSGGKSERGTAVFT